MNQLDAIGKANNASIFGNGQEPGFAENQAMLLKRQYGELRSIISPMHLDMNWKTLRLHMKSRLQTMI